MTLDSSPANFASGYRPLLYNFTSDELDTTVFPIRVISKINQVTELPYIPEADENDVSILVSTFGFNPVVGESVKIVGNVYEGVHVIKWVRGTRFSIEKSFESDASTGDVTHFFQNHFAEVSINLTTGLDYTVNRLFEDDGTFKIDIQKYLQQNFENNLNPTTSATITDNDGQLTNKVTINVKEFSDKVVDGEIISEEIDTFDGSANEKIFCNAIRQYIELSNGDIRKTIEDKVEDEYVAEESVVSSDVRFLTDANRGGVFIDRDSPYQLSVLYNDPTPPSQVSFRAEFFDSSGASIVALTTTLNPSTDSMTFGCGTSNLTVPANAVYYTVVFRDAFNNEVTEQFRIDINDNCTNLFNRFYWQNQKGGLDGFIFRGEEAKSSGFKKERSKRSFADANTLLPEANLRTFRTQVDESFQVNSGWVSRKDIEWLEQMVYSNNVFEWMPEINEYVPIVIESQKVSLDNNRDATFNLQITYKRAFEKIIQDA